MDDWWALERQTRPQIWQTRNDEWWGWIRIYFLVTLSFSFGFSSKDASQWRAPSFSYYFHHVDQSINVLYFGTERLFLIFLSYLFTVTIPIWARICWPSEKLSQSTIQNKVNIKLKFIKTIKLILIYYLFIYFHTYLRYGCSWRGFFSAHSGSVLLKYASLFRQAAAKNNKSKYNI